MPDITRYLEDNSGGGNLLYHSVVASADEWRVYDAAIQGDAWHRALAEHWLISRVGGCLWRLTDEVFLHDFGPNLRRKDYA